MSDPLFLVHELPAGEDCVLAGPEGHHAATVQRLRPGERLTLGDGRGGTASAEVVAVGRGTVTARVLSRGYEPPPAPRFVVVQGIPKGDRGELAVQAMTEVGVDEVIPWEAARAVVKWHGERGTRAHERWVSTAREAAKLARRAWLPEMAPVHSTRQLLPRLDGAYVLHESATARLSTVELPEGRDVVLVVGPEGGISDEELRLFADAGATAVRLGAPVLRTSTAGVAALAVLSIRLGRW